MQSTHDAKQHHPTETLKESFFLQLVAFVENDRRQKRVVDHLGMNGRRQ